MNVSNTEQLVRSSSSMDEVTGCWAGEWVWSPATPKSSQAHREVILLWHPNTDQLLHSKVLSYHTGFWRWEEYPKGSGMNVGQRLQVGTNGDRSQWLGRGRSQRGRLNVETICWGRQGQIAWRDSWLGWPWRERWYYHWWVGEGPMGWLQGLWGQLRAL